jgi:hypothetical protein
MATGRPRRDPLALWFLGLAALGLVRSWLVLVREPGGWTALGIAWLGGSLLLALAGLWLMLRRR